MRIEITNNQPEKQIRFCYYCGKTHYEICPKLYKDFNLEKVYPYKNTFTVSSS